MIRAVANWNPTWYGLDQPLAVGQTSDFLLITSCLPIRFATNFEQGILYKATVSSIYNEGLGSIIKIDTGELSYKFYFTQVDYIQIEAEETPGKFETGAKCGQYLVDKTFTVELELLCQDNLLLSI